MYFFFYNVKFTFAKQECFYLSDDDPLVSLLWSGVRLVLEWAELGVGGPPYLLELPTGVERPPYTSLLRPPFPLRVGASNAYGSPLQWKRIHESIIGM